MTVPNGVFAALVLSTMLASGGAEARVRHHGTRFWYTGGYADPARGRWSDGRYFPNTHEPRRFVHGPGVVVSH